MTNETIKVFCKSRGIECSTCKYNRNCPDKRGPISQISSEGFYIKTEPLLENINKKPPIGIMSKKLWQEKRIEELKEAILRYIDSNTKVPIEWIEEYNDSIK